jgi:DnaK suppressor protein
MTKAINGVYYSNRGEDVQSTLTHEETIFFKEGLEKEKVTIRTNLNMSSNEMDNFRNTNPKDEADHASIALEQTLGTKLSQIQAKKLLLIEKSLKKIENNSYGICDLCEEPINPERLKIKMFAEYCICCREIVEQGRH